MPGTAAIEVEDEPLKPKKKKRPKHVLRPLHEQLKPKRPAPSPLRLRLVSFAM
jgi:hypothetical protein